jgi:hypothetical protein
MRNIKILTLLFAILIISSFATANIWIDEDFADGVAFDAGALDPYDDSAPPTPPITVTATGSMSTDKAWDSTVHGNSYKLEAGQKIEVLGVNYSEAANGAFQYLQLAVNIGEIPTAGSMATLEYYWSHASPASNWTFVFDFVSTGSAVDIVAGQTVPSVDTATIATLSNTSDWVYLTFQFQKNSGTEDDNDAARPFLQTGVAQGAYFYASSTSAGHSVALGEAFAIDESDGWVLNVTSGSLYIGDLYWEGGMDLDAANSNPRALDNPTVVTNWDMFE